MAISGNPKMLAYEIAKGLVNVSPTSLKKYTPEDLKVILTNLSIVQREIRSKQIPQENLLEIKEKNYQLQHINQAITIITNHAKKHRFRI